MSPRALVAPDDVKGTFTAPEVAAAIAAGLRSADVEADELPIADGGNRTINAVGGSATIDGGAGALEALREAAVEVPVTVICDVRVPFEKAAGVFGPQKGADAEMVARLTRGLHSLAQAAPRDPRRRDMTGAAGGLSGGLWAFCGAELVAGARFVLDTVGFDERLRTASFAVSGEGKLDRQTLTGKAVAEVARRCRAASRPLHVIVGTSALAPDVAAALGLASIREATTIQELETAGRELALSLTAGGSQATHEPTATSREA